MSVVSLDIGSSAIVAVELDRGRDRMNLSRAVLEPLPPGVVVEGVVMKPDELGERIEALWERSRIKTKRVRLGIANQRVFVRNVDIPSIDDPAERRAAIEFEAAGHIPIPPEHAVVDFHLTGETNDGGNGRRDRVVLVAAHRENIDQLLRAVRSAGLEPESIDLEAFALMRAVLRATPDIDRGSPDLAAQAICHVGSGTTNVVVSIDHVCHFTRLCSTGGDDLTRFVAEKLRISEEEAEDLKRRCGMIGDIPDDLDAKLVGKVRYALAIGARPLVQDIGRSLEYYRSQPTSRPLSRMVLSGGSSLLTGFDRYLEQSLGVRTLIALPLERLGGNVVDKALAAQAIVAVGLGLDRGANE